MAFFIKNTQASHVNNNNSEETQTDETSLEQIEMDIVQLVKKIQLSNEKNQRLIGTQKGKLESLKSQLQRLEGDQSAVSGQLQQSLQAYGGNPATVPQLRKKSAELIEKIATKRLEIGRVELDITILERTRDEESISALKQAWKDYEDKMFSEFITPLEVEITAAKAFYFEKLKQIRSKYTMLENLTLHLQPGLLGNDNVPLYSWSGAIQQKPQLLITTDDELKEFTITNTYRAE